MTGISFPSGLVSAARSGDAVPFIGSGVSQASGIGSWDEIVQALRRRMVNSRDPTQSIDLDQFELPDAFAAKGNFELIEILQESVERGFVPNEFHQLLADIPFRTCVTTNWDRLIEMALGVVGRVNVVFNDATARSWRESSGTQVIKIHGSIHAPETVVFGLKGYAKFYDRPSVLMSLVRTLLATRPILSIGFGMKDPFLKALFYDVNADGGREHYIVMPETVMDNTRRRYLEGLGLTIVDAPCETEDPYGTGNFLRQLRAHTYVEASSRVDRTQMLVRETDRLSYYIGSDRTIRVRANLGPLAVPLTNELDVFGGEDIFTVEARLLDSVVAFLSRPGTRLRLICCPFVEEAYVSRKGYSSVTHRARLSAFRDWVIKLGDSVELVTLERPSDLNDWITADVALIESRKSAKLDGRLYEFAKLELNPNAVSRAVRRFDEEFRMLVDRNGGLAAARDIFLSGVDRIT